MTIFFCHFISTFLLSFHVLLLNKSGHFIIVISTFYVVMGHGIKEDTKAQILAGRICFPSLAFLKKKNITVGMSKSNFLYLFWRICLKVAVRFFSERRMIILFLIVGGKEAFIFVILVTSCVPTGKARFAYLVKHGLASF